MERDIASFDGSLPSDISESFFRFKAENQTYKNAKLNENILKEMLMKSPNPLLLALKFCANCKEDDNYKKKNFSLFILETAHELYKEQPHIADNCDENTRLFAFHFIKTCGIASLYKNTATTFELRKIKDLLVPEIKKLITEGNAVPAAHWAMILEVSHVFETFDISFLLIFQGHASLADEYLSFAKSMILPTVEFLDSLLNANNIRKKCEEIIALNKYEDIKDTYWNRKTMTNLVKRLAKKYDIGEHLTPNLVYSKTCAYIHQMWRKYCSGEMCRKAWRELMHEVVSNKPMQTPLITTIASSKDFDEVIYWVNFYRIPQKDCPTFLRKNLRKINTRRSIQSNGLGVAKTNSSTKEMFLTLDLPLCSVIFVDNRKIFLKMISYLKTQPRVAIDSESKPFTVTENVVALLQLATTARVFLLDSLSTDLSADLWQQLAENIFNNEKILKIGFALHQDLCTLRKSVLVQMNNQENIGYLDLQQLWHHLKNLQIAKFPFGDKTCSESLSALINLCLGKKLNKENQCSNWANRPLRIEQVAYAALDAHCLLDIYKVLSEKLDRVGLNINEVIEEMQVAVPDQTDDFDATNQ